MVEKISQHTFSKNIEKKSIRDGFGDGLVEAGANPSVVVLTADLAESTRASYFAEKYPERFFECGVSEQGMITVCSGFANYGKKPFACSFAAFSPGRNWEQIRTTIALNDVPVVICGLFVGVSVGPDGATHQMLEDISLMRSIPNMTIVAPSDYLEAKRAVVALSTLKHPAYIRVPRVESQLYTTDETSFEIGKANLIWKDPHVDVCLIAHGTMVYKTLEAVKLLNKKSIGCAVINCHTLKPVDFKTIMPIVNEAGCFVVAEEHQEAGGLFSAISEFVIRNYPVPGEVVAVNDRFGQSGQPDELFEEYGLTKESIAQKAIVAIGRKKRGK